MTFAEMPAEEAPFSLSFFLLVRIGPSLYPISGGIVLGEKRTIVLFFREPLNRDEENGCKEDDHA